MALLVSSLLLGGCRRVPGQGEPGGVAPAVVTVWHSLQGSELNALTLQLQSLMREQPGVIVKTVYIPEDRFAAQAFQAEAGGAGPQIFLARREVIRQLYFQGALAPLAAANQDGFPAAQAEFRFGGKDYAAPWLTDVALFFYRQDLVPPPPTLAGLLQKGGLALAAFDAATLAPWWRAQGGHVLVDGQPALAAPENSSFVQQFAAAQDQQKLLVTPTAEALFAGGQYPFLVGWASRAPQLSAPWASLPLSDLVGGQEEALLGPTLAVANSAVQTTPALRGAIAAVEGFLLRPEVEAEMTKAGHRVPANRQFYQRAEAKQGLWPQVFQVLSKAWVVEGSAPEWKLLPIQDSAWASAMAHKAAVPEALAKAQADAIKALQQPGS